MASVLKRGSKGAAVRDLQRLLSAAGYPVGVIDGDFGGITDKAVRRFQHEVGLVVDGRVGPQTLTALKQFNHPIEVHRPEPDKSAMAAPAPATDAVHPAGAAPPPNAASLKLLETSRPIKELIWHCAATPEGKDFTVDDIRAWHRQRGWSDVGYHYIVYRDGRIMLGRPVGQTGSHVAGRNTGTVGCCYIGGVSADGKAPKDTRTPAQKSSMLWLTEQLIKKHRIPKVTGHNDHTNAKACPSFKVGSDPLGQLV